MPQKWFVSKDEFDGESLIVGLKRSSDKTTGSL